MDILRILGMLGIVILHIEGQGGVLKSCGDTPAYWVEVLAYTSVDIFGILSGYLGIHKKNVSSFRAIELAAIVFIYCMLVTVFMKCIFPQNFESLRDIAIGLFPQIEGRYWYITCYIPIAILQPFINKAILCFSEKEHL